MTKATEIWGWRRGQHRNCRDRRLIDDQLSNSARTMLPQPSRMKRRTVLIQLSCLAASSLLPLNSRRGALAQPLPNAPYAVFPNFDQLDLPVGDCNELELRLVLVEKELKYAKTNWKEVGDRYRRRVNSRLVELRRILSKAETRASKTQRKKYIEATAFGVGILLAGVGFVFSSPIVIGLAVGAQVLLGPTTLVMHAVWNTTSNGPWMAITVFQDRSFMIGKAIGEAARSSAGRVFAHSISAVQFGLMAWQMSRLVSDHKEAILVAERARAEIKSVERIVERFRDNKAQWSNLYIKNLEFLSISLKSYIDDTRDYNCIIPRLIKPPLP